MEAEVKPVSGGSAPPPAAFPVGTPTSSFRAELFPACLSVLMISGTCRSGEQRGKSQVVKYTDFLKQKTLHMMYIEQTVKH